jgi:Fic family protein
MPYWNQFSEASIPPSFMTVPPEAKTVPGLMADLMAWINQQLHEGDLPVPLIAALAHYQFATIHPYYDGNGRTARLLANLILHKAGYGLKGIYSLDEYYARNLAGYYEALTVGPSHNYHLGRAEADVTGFLELKNPSRKSRSYRLGKEFELLIE